MSVAEIPVSHSEFGGSLTRYVSDLKRWAGHLAPQSAEASDLVQETCCRALERQAQFRTGTDLRAWLGCMLRNLHRDQRRRGWREVLAEDAGHHSPAPDVDPPRAWSQVSDEDLSLALESLAPVYRTPYVLHTVDGCSYKDIARQMGIPSGTVGTRLYRARFLLRKFLEERMDAAEDERAQARS